MKRNAHMASGASKGRFGEPLGRRIFCAFLTLALVMSSIPTASVRVFAEDFVEEQVTEAAEPAPEPEVEPVVEPTPEPEPVAEPETAAAPEAEPLVEEPAQTEAAPQLRAAPEAETEPAVEVTAPLLGAPNVDTVTLTAIGPTTETPLEDGTYAPLEVAVRAIGLSISATDYPTLTLTYKDINGTTRSRSYQLDDSSWQIISGAGVATVQASIPGTYVSASISGGSCIYEGETVELRGSANFSPQFTISGVAMGSITMLDKDGQKVRDSSNNVIDLLDVTTRTVVDPEVIQVRVAGDLVVDRSMAQLYDNTGYLIDVGVFEPDPENPGMYVAELDGFTISSAVQDFQDGTYAIQVFAEDTSGNKLTDGVNDYVLVCGTEEPQTDGTKLTLPDGNLVVDRTSPDVTVEYPHDQASGTYTPETSDSVSYQVADVPEKIDFFNGTTVVKVTIEDFDLSAADTTVFGVPLSQIMANPQTAISGIPCDVYTSTAESGAPVVRVEAYCGDGVYGVTDIVSARDANANHAATTLDHLSFDGHALDITHFIVDLSAPAITAAKLEKAPVGQGTDDNNRIWFVAGNGNVITLTVEEAHGIRSVEMLDASKTYVGSLGDVSSALQSGNAGLTDASHAGTYNLHVLNNLQDGRDFPDDIMFVITDFAGNQYFWSMNTEGWSGTADTGVLNPTTNTDLAYEDEGGSLVDMLHPTLLVPDDTDPLLAVTGPADRTDPAASGYERFFNAEQSLSLTLTELNIKYLAGFKGGDTLYDPNSFVNGTFAGLDPKRSVLTYTFTPADGSPVENRTVTVSNLLPQSTAGVFLWETKLSADGDYSNIQGSFTDVAGHESSTTTIPDFTIDTTAPVIAVEYDNDSSSKGMFFAAERTATITVTEHNFDPTLFTIAITAQGGAQGMFAPTPSGWTDNGDTHTCKVAFSDDAAYTMTISGQDKAGNAADPYDSGVFVIDIEAPVIAKYYENGAAPASTFDTDDPVVELPEPTGTYDDGSGTIYFYTHAISVDARIQDRNFDAKDTTLSVTKDGTETMLDGSWVRNPDEMGPNGYELHEVSVAYTEDGEYTAPHVIAGDLALNETDNAADANAVRIVLDLKAPTLAVSVDQQPSAQGAGEDPTNFYNAQTTMTITVSDEHLLRSVALDDPDGLYTVTQSETSAEGQPQVVLTVALKDGSGTQDGVFDRPITLTAEDLAGNSRTWTIDHKGEVTLDSSTAPADNASINDAGVFPVALIQDTVPPVVALSGATAGTYYNSPQSVTATVAEYCMDWLQMFDGGRVIVTVTERPGMAGAGATTRTITASEFAGSRPDFSSVIDFSGDGHYSLSAQFQDFAGNMSNLATIGEFTIDMTPPLITVDWDNNESRNGKYYKATRTATITVTEHNFDPSLINIQTTGAIGGWATNGDTHTCTVFFGEGSAHTLTVSGSDLAGNQASEITEPEFVVDLTEPEITIAGVAQRLGYLSDNASEGLVNAYHGELEDLNAYNGVVVPTITYSDNEVLSASDLSFTITGSKNGEEVEYSTATSPEAKEMTTTFRDLGYVGPGAGDGSNWDEFYVDDYDVNADDIYVITASMTDQAGNEAEAEIVFSVNRYGSNYIVSLLGLDPDELAEYQQTGMLSEAPTIVVHEISVSGVDYLDENGNLVTDNHHVQKEFANVTTSIDQNSGLGSGYGLVTIDNEEQEVGWSEYIYTIRSANFGEGSDSDNNDRGQGLYRVNVMSDDLSSNANSTAAYWSSDAARREATAAGSTTEFVLDETAPAIDDLNLPEHLSAGESYEASFHVTDDITSGNQVQVFVDGVELAASEVRGPAGGVGTYTFDIPSRAFDWSRDVHIVVTDYAGRSVEAGNGTWIWQSSFIPEGLSVAGVVAVAVAAGVAINRRRRAQEPEMPA